MTVFAAGFSERVFEFGFNAEYAAANHAVLAAAPSIPTQNKEKYLGYDVLFELKKAGGVTNVLALQHKVVRMVDSASGTNIQFCGIAGLPYYAFRLNAWQFNLIETIASAGLVGVEFYFCMPQFTTQAAMNSHYMAKTVAANALWIDVAGIGSLNDSGPHSIIVNAPGTAAWVCSGEPKPLKVSKPRLHRAERARKTALEQPVLRKAYSEIFRIVDEHWKKRPAKAERREFEGDTVKLPAVAPVLEDLLDSQSPIESLGNLLGEYGGMTLLAETPLTKPS